MKPFPAVVPSEQSGFSNRQKYLAHQAFLTPVESSTIIAASGMSMNHLGKKKMQLRGRAATEKISGGGKIAENNLVPKTMHKALMA